MAESSASDSSQAVSAPNRGYWCQTWESVTPLPGATLGIAFSGWAAPDSAISNSASTKDKLVGAKLISLGGGNKNGAFSAGVLEAIDAAIKGGDFAGYDGIAYDVEEGDSGLSQAFATSFAAAKAAGFKVLVTVSHSAPYGISDAPALMKGFFADDSIDLLSPQLYTGGNETQNDYATTDGVLWTEYAAAKAAVIPSIVSADLYPSAQTYFSGQGVELQGYIQWK